jgi:hypothetical protein
MVNESYLTVKNAIYLSHTPSPLGHTSSTPGLVPYRDPLGSQSVLSAETDILVNPCMFRK